MVTSLYELRRLGWPIPKEALMEEDLQALADRIIANAKEVCDDCKRAPAFPCEYHRGFAAGVYEMLGEVAS